MNGVYVQVKCAYLFCMYIKMCIVMYINIYTHKHILFKRMHEIKGAVNVMCFKMHTFLFIFTAILNINKIWALKSISDSFNSTIKVK